MKYQIQNRNFLTCKPEACEENNWEGYDNGYTEALPVGKYNAYAVSYTPDSGKTWSEKWYLTDSEVNVETTSYGDECRRICRVWKVNFNGKRIRKIK